MENSEKTEITQLAFNKIHAKKMKRKEKIFTVKNFKFQINNECSRKFVQKIN